MTNLIDTTARNAGILSPKFKDSSIFIAGVSGGSYLIEKLARQGIDHLTICDPAYVKTETLSRTAFQHGDVFLGKSKVEAMATRLYEIHGLHNGASIDMHCCEVQELEASAFLNHDAILALTDNLEAQAYLSDMAVKLKIPFLAIGIHAQGKGGHILWRVPEDGHACYRCGLPERFEATDDDVNLESEPANLVDIQSIDMPAMRIILAILDRGQSSVMGRYYEAIRNKGYAVIGNHPDYEYGNTLVNALLNDLPTTPKNYAHELKQCAFLSGYTVWLESAADKNCPICGSAEQS